MIYVSTLYCTYIHFTAHTYRWFHPKWTALEKVPVENRSLVKEGSEVSQVTFFFFSLSYLYLLSTINYKQWCWIFLYYFYIIFISFLYYFCDIFIIFSSLLSSSFYLIFVLSFLFIVCCLHIRDLFLLGLIFSLIRMLSKPRPLKFRAQRKEISRCVMYIFPWIIVRIRLLLYLSWILVNRIRNFPSLCIYFFSTFWFYF